MEEKKLCPLRGVSCDGEHCALWSKTGRCCVFGSIGWSLKQLVHAIKELQKKDGTE